MSKRALISVTDKSNIVEFSKELIGLGYEIISTGNTHRILVENGLDAISIEDVTGFPEILDGRVKTLNPYIHGGLLYKRDEKTHCDTVEKHEIKAIDMVVVNLYNFEGNLKDKKEHDTMIENIDIGGPSMIRSAAKNYKDVVVVTDIEDYDMIIDELKSKGEVSLEKKEKLAYKAFSLTAHYDSIISNYFMDKVKDEHPRYLNLTFERESKLRYGENPHQRASLYKENYAIETILDFEQLNGKELSFNNINDLNGALEIVREFDEDPNYDENVIAVGIKHTNPCGVGIAKTPFEAFEKAYEGDKVSIFGGIVAINSLVDAKTAQMLNSIFLEIVAAYGYTDEALEILTKKKNLRVLKLEDLKNKTRNMDVKYLDGKLLLQDRNRKVYDELKVVTKKQPQKSQLADMEFGMKVLKHAKSNAICIVKDGMTLALGLGQTSRIWALKNALENNSDKDFSGSVLVSDAFFPFDDCVRLAKEYNIDAIIQPGGSINDKDSIKACDELDMSMVFSGIRHFKH